jgi:hypothetical protein
MQLYDQPFLLVAFYSYFVNNLFAGKIKTLSLKGQGNQTLKLKNNPYRSTPVTRHTYKVCVWCITVNTIHRYMAHEPALELVSINRY